MVNWEKVIRLSVVALLSAFWTSFVVVKIIIDIIRHGREKIFKKVERNQRPKVFDNNLWKHDTVKLSQVKLHYVHCGSRDKPLMLFVHGFPEFWYTWRHQLKEFSKDYWCVAIDMRGYNESDRPTGIKNYHMKWLTQDIRECVEALGRQSCILVAHDWGGAVAWATALRYPEIVDKLVIMNSPHPAAMMQHLYSSVKQMLKSWYMFFFQFPLIPEFQIQLGDYHMIDEAFKGEKMGARNKNAFSKEDIEAWKYVWSRPGALTAAINYYRATFQLDRMEMPKEKVAPPTLIIWGTEDGALDTCLAQMSAKFCKNAVVRHVNGASHWVQQDNPTECHKYMREFLE